MTHKWNLLMISKHTNKNNKKSELIPININLNSFIVSRDHTGTGMTAVCIIIVNISISQHNLRAGELKTGRNR